MKRFLPVAVLLVSGGVVAVAARGHFQPANERAMPAPSSSPARIANPPSAGGSLRAEPDGAPASAVLRSTRSEGAGPSPAGTRPAESTAAAAPAADAGTGDEVVGHAPGRSPRGTRAEGGAEPEPADILRRAAAAYAEIRSFQAEFVQEMYNPILRRTYASRGTLFQKRPDKLLLRFSDPEGDVVVSDGVYFWVHYPSTDAGQVLRSPAGTGPGAVDLQAQFMGDPTERFDYVLDGRELVGGREAHVLALAPKERGAGYRALKVWIDAQDYLARRFEITEENGGVRRFDLSGLRLNPALSDTLFQFVPPPDARIVQP